MPTEKVTREQRGSAILSLFNFGLSSHFDIVERRLRKVRGILNATVDYAGNVVVVDYDPAQLTMEQIRNVITKFTQDTVI